ncbi:Phosphocholine transferase AnkX [Legionella massiliensis]|uniref:Phosphocholine transferase AnkX n=1 Tax=Legionella massiliensis TaxID=1034943 RepID=A0A078L391_9GAMM|nr:ankyrin repeat domain-containing protein [Legionella massiliensis]CDZ78584.1 Phosphocholine transferase AnkX [Legionella massiliensis]CEE14322.1 Phosphocholine transferase AnkX [Legionella massiliensis]
MPNTHTSSSSSSSSTLSDDALPVDWVALLQSHSPHIFRVTNNSLRTNTYCQKIYANSIDHLLENTDSLDESTIQLKGLITDVPQILDKTQQVKLVELIVDLIKRNSTNLQFMMIFTNRLHHCLPVDLASALYEYAITQKTPFKPIHWAIICDQPLSESLAIDINDASLIAPLYLASDLNKPELVSTLLAFNAEVDLPSYGKTSSMLACIVGFTEVLKRLHQASANLEVVVEEDGFNLLHCAATTNELATVEYLLEHNPKLINSKNNRGEKPLKVALANGQIKIAELLVDKTEDLPNNGFTLLEATVAGSIKLVEAFLARGLPTDSTDNNGNTALHLALQCGHEQIAKFLLEKAPALLKTTDNTGQNPLHVAALKGCHESVKLIKGIDENLAKAQDDSGLFPLHMAVINGCSETVAVLLEGIGSDTILQNNTGRTPTHLAAQVDNVKILEFLLEKAPQWTQVRDRNGLSPLHIAVSNGSIESVKLLVKNAPELIRLQNPDGLTALHFAARFNKHEIARILMEADPSLAQVPNRYDRLPLDVAAQYDSVETARVILEIKPELAEAKTHDQITALHTAAMQDSVQVAELLLEKAPGLASCGDNYGNTPAHIAAIHDKTKVAKLLLEKNKQLFSKFSHRYQTACELAVEHNGLEVLKLILDYIDGEPNLISYAVRVKNYPAIDLIIEAGIYLSPANLVLSLLEEITRRIEANTEFYKLPADTEDKVGTLLGRALRVCREQLIMADEQIPVYPLVKLDVLLPMPIGYTYLGEWFIPQAMAGDHRYLELLEKSKEKPLALARWFANAPKNCGYEHLAIKLVTYRTLKKGLISQTIELTDEEASALHSGQIDSLQTLSKRYPHEQLRKWLNALIEAPETAAFHKPCQNCLEAFDRNALLARLRVLREKRIATQSRQQQAEGKSRIPQFIQPEQQLIRSKRVSPEQPSSSGGPDLKFQRTAREDDRVESGELFSYSSSSSSSSSNEEAAGSFGCISDRRCFILEAIAGSEEALNYLNACPREDRASWFKNNGNVLEHKRLALKLVTRQFMAGNPEHCLQLEKAEESAFCEGKLSALGSLYDKMPYRLGMSWLEKLATAPETIYLHEVCRELITIFQVRHARERLDAFENRNVGLSHSEPAAETLGQRPISYFFQSEDSADSSSVPVSNDYPLSFLASLD